MSIDLVSKHKAMMTRALFTQTCVHRILAPDICNLHCHPLILNSNKHTNHD